ncbi:lytic transglycosylase domain-containing protein [Sphingobium phenoxybenzoativorans]|uniref:Lytic transglycosylase domain-containing protein n=1 Tax=Sphingobium phenoxybenzoativorans TaxID=1592790 RepID=A0A975Q0A2_9SPHN|nr:lytic transglycosylase domain-containing protein [Sphingobium phenoxybenzoativorans]QUT04183.1 lytic transglycosylase domain-containing protein [Sphingobium phenoxybenzoativorans]
MSSMVSHAPLLRISVIAFLLSTASAGAQTGAPTSILPEQMAQPTPAPAPQQAPGMVQPVPGAGQPSPWNRASSQLGVPRDGQIVSTIAQWRALQQSDTLGFSTYASFITANPDWPGQDRMRRLAETSINPNAYDPNQVAAFFARYPAKTAVGRARNAVALSSLGRRDEAKLEARAAWVAGGLTADDESRLISLFGGSFTTADYDQRADALLWQKNTGGVDRILAYTSPARRPVFQARSAMLRKAPDAAAKMQAAEAYGQNDAGFLADKAMWLRDSGNSIAACTLLANRQSVSNRPSDAEKWYEALLTNARAAANDSQWSFAWAIASKVDDAYAAGIDVRDRPIGERDDYTSLTWLAGTTAFYNLNRPSDALGMFQRYATAARSPQTISKGYYWAGRAALEMNDKARANSFFAQAAAYPDQFYGQLALERLGRPIPAPAMIDRPVEISAADRSAFDNRSVVRAAKALGTMGLYEDQSKFLRAIAASAETDKGHFMSAELAQTLSRPDLGVMVGRRAISDGLSGYGTSSFPRIPVPSGHQANWTMIHAIARQESQFDRAAVSHAGARGLMQLMPGTAAQTAGRIGLSYNAGALTTDTSYNIQLGSTYFQQMLNYYSGSYPLAVAAYNAGPGNVNKWLAANGDPRIAGSDVLRWIERIPIYETRNYVQRVLENAIVYDAMNPANARFRGSQTPLSRYLGKNTPG